MPVAEQGDRILTLTSESKSFPINHLLDDDGVCPNAVITLKEVKRSDRVFITGKCSEHETWVANSRLLHGTIELKHGMTLTFGAKGIFPTA
jgi:hypothetical protein